MSGDIAFDALAPLSSRLGFKRDSGRSVLRWLLELGGDEAVARWCFEQLDQKCMPA